MYGWGSDDSSSDTNYSGGGYDYSGARDAYTAPSGGTYSGGSSSGSASAGASRPASVDTDDSSAVGEHAAGKRIKSESAFPVLVRIDVTGSNRSNVGVFWKKLPLLFTEAERICPGVEISFAAIADAGVNDSFPLQVRDFKAGADLDSELQKLRIERGWGGGNHKESYQLSGVFDLRCVDTPNARQPYLFLLCDEGVYTEATADEIKRVVGIDSETISTAALYEQLKLKYNLYILHSPYGGGDDAAVLAQWREIVGEERVLLLEDPARVVDVIIGIMSANAGMSADFKTRLTARQTVAQVGSVMKTLTPVVAAADASAAVAKTGKSVMKTGDDSGSTDKKSGSDTRSKPLM